MDFALSEEQQMIYDYGKNLYKDFDRDYWVRCAEVHAFPTEMYKKAAEDGFVGMMVPEAYGGAGLGMTEMALFQEGLSDMGIPLQSLVVGATMSLSPIGKHGTEAQKQKYLPGGCAGDIRFCFAITEPDAGTNTMRITSTLKDDGQGGYRLNGRKTFITDAGESDYMLVVSRNADHAESTRKTDGFTIAIIDAKAQGIETQPIDVSIPMPEKQYQVFFDDVAVGADDILGEVGKGFNILFESLNPERIILAAMCAGLGRYAMGRAVDYANERVVFDGPIGAYQALQHPLAKGKTEIEMASLMARKAAWLYDQGLPCAAESNMAKFAASEAAVRAIDASLQCFGGNGFTKEYGIYDIYPIARLLKTAPLNNEMVLNYIGEHVMGLPRSY
ncbi:MAG: acyl-CoA/acyl-ACP dehydrogenase [Gammaproteobacteria bacterium]|nr:acyl-CoA/acyl-ACP dehydrogenase [Gammaproteobacteria bacterium]MBQ0838941.1 acyl-CoA/acyl-ACP dehydrogenase [Gammaproteobacteria bacterium]